MATGASMSLKQTALRKIYPLMKTERDCKRSKIMPKIRKKSVMPVLTQNLFLCENCSQKRLLSFRLASFGV